MFFKSLFKRRSLVPAERSQGDLSDNEISKALKGEIESPVVIAVLQLLREEAAEFQSLSIDPQAAEGEMKFNLGGFSALQCIRWRLEGRLRGEDV